MKKYKHNRIGKGGFTLVELLMATMVTTIILTALATLASAMSNADRETKNMSEQQAQVRYFTLRLTELIRNASYIIPVYNPRKGIVVWTESVLDGAPKPYEVVYVELDTDDGVVKWDEAADGSVAIRLAGAGEIEFLEFSDQTVGYYISAIESGDARTYWVNNGTSRFTTVLPECSNVILTLDADRKNVGLSFDISENGATRTYETYATRRCSIEHALDDVGELIYPYGDDDL